MKIHWSVYLLLLLVILVATLLLVPRESAPFIYEFF